MADKRGRLDPVHPGSILGRTLKDLEITPYALAKAIGKTPIQVHRIINGAASVTATWAVLLSKAFGTSAQMWLNLQTQYDLEIASRAMGGVDVKPLVGIDAKCA